MSRFSTYPRAFRSEEMKVLTLRHPDFLAAVDSLALRVGRRPDIVVGILEGGGHVGRRLAERLGVEPGRYFEVRLQRPSSARKSGAAVGSTLRRLPLWLLNLMRIAESWLLALRKPRRLADVELPAALAAALATGKGATVLVADDAVDSGATLAAVVRAIRRAAPDATVESAVLTVTTSSPLIRPEYSLYSNHTLIRFPWSKDAR